MRIRIQEVSHNAVPDPQNWFSSSYNCTGIIGSTYATTGSPSRSPNTPFGLVEPAEDSSSLRSKLVLAGFTDLAEPEEIVLPNLTGDKLFIFLPSLQGCRSRPFLLEPEP